MAVPCILIEFSGRKWMKGKGKCIYFHSTFMALNWNSTSIRFAHEWYAKHTEQTMVVICLSQFENWNWFFVCLKFLTNESPWNCAEKEYYVK